MEDDMNEDEKFLDLVQNHNISGSLRDGHGNFCMLGALVKAYDSYEGMTVLEELIQQNFPHMINPMEPDLSNVAYFNDHYSTHEDRVLVAKLFVEQRNG